MAVIVVKHEFEGDRNFDKLSLWLVPITITCCEKKITVNVLLDTGSQKTLLVPHIQKLLNISATSGTQVGSGVSGNSNYSIVQVDNLEIGSISFGSIDILVGQLPQTFYQNKISGLLGADILKMLCITVDYPQKLLIIEKTVVLP